MFDVDNGIKKRIMRRVYTIWLVRKMTSPLGIEFMLLIVMSSVTLYSISLFDVMRNAFGSSSSFTSLSKFFLDNFMVTDLISQILAVGLIGIAMAIIITRELPRRERIVLR